LFFQTVQYTFPAQHYLLHLCLINSLDTVGSISFNLLQVYFCSIRQSLCTFQCGFLLLKLLTACRSCFRKNLYIIIVIQSQLICILSLLNSNPCLLNHGGIVLYFTSLKARFNFLDFLVHISELYFRFLFFHT